MYPLDISYQALSHALIVSVAEFKQAKSDIAECNRLKCEAWTKTAFRKLNAKRKELKQVCKIAHVYLYQDQYLF